MSYELDTQASSVFMTTESGLPSQDGYITKQPNYSKGDFYKPLGEPDSYPTPKSSGWFTM